MKRGKLLSLLPPVFLLILFLRYPAELMAGAREGLRLSAERIVPALFPVGVLAVCLMKMGYDPGASGAAAKLTSAFFGLPGCCALPILLGLLGGYPLGAQLCALQYREGRIDRCDAIRLSAVCNNAGPAFLIGVLGTALGDPKLGVFLYLIQLASVLLVGLLLRRDGDRTEGSHSSQTGCAGGGFFALLPSSVGEAAAGMLRLTGSIVFFRAAIAGIQALFPLFGLPLPLRAALSGFLELAGGSSLLCALPSPFAFLLASGLSAWGGLCVHLQAAAFLRSEGLPMKRYLLGKLLTSLISALMAIFLLTWNGQLASYWIFPSAFGLLLLIFFSFFEKRRWKMTGAVI